MKKVFNKKVNLFIVYSLCILYLEILFKFYKYGNIFNIGILHTLIFTCTISFVLTLLTSIFNDKINKIIYFIMLSFITVLFLVQFVFSGLFSTLFSFSSIGLADQAIDFINIVFSFIFNNFILFLLFLIPIILSIIFNKKINCTKLDKTHLIIYVCGILSYYLISLIILIPGKSNLYSAYEFYFERNEPTLAADKLGVLTTMRLDFTRWLIGFEENIIIDNGFDHENGNKEDNADIKYNILDIDFAAIAQSENNDSLKQLASYFANATKTEQNEYTGMFKDKNLIFILAEGFNEIAVDQNLTPTLYKLTHEGFNFKNFYSPVFLSTTGGEFQAMTGLIPTQEILSSWKKVGKELSFSLGNSFGRLGYNVNAYHNWTYSYYSRDITMPSLGFNSYLGCRNGLEKYMDCQKWPTSDIDLMNATTNLYASKDQKFMTYYITLSGHAEYNFSGNYIAKKNKNLVEDLNYSTPIKAYLATQMEMDRALETLIRNLDEQGILDDTVIALVGDHYPYTIDVDIINEIATYKKDPIVEVNHSNFIIWNNGMEPIEITKVGSQIDVLPTLLNLFGIEYDSRLIVGKDILSSTEGLAIFSNRSWVSDQGTYFANSKKFVPNSGVEVSDEYINYINNEIANKYTISKLIIDNNYYKYILNK